MIDLAAFFHMKMNEDLTGSVKLYKLHRSSEVIQLCMKNYMKFNLFYSVNRPLQWAVKRSHCIIELNWTNHSDQFCDLGQPFHQKDLI